MNPDDILNALPAGDRPAVSVALDGAAVVATLTYADAATYSARCSADDTAMRALPGWSIVDASMGSTAPLWAPTTYVVTMRLAPAPLPASSPDTNNSGAPRRKDR